MGQAKSFLKYKIDLSVVDFAEIAQLVERRTENPCVPSSILGLGTILPQPIKIIF